MDKKNFRNGKRHEYVAIRWFRKNKYVNLLHQNDDRKIDGILPVHNLNPDLIFELNVGQNKYPFAIECKRHSRMSSKYINVCNEDQLQRYLTFNEICPTFILLSIGGLSITAPYHLYLIPIDQVKPRMHRAELDKFETNYGEIPFYDYQNQQFLCYTMRPKVIYPQNRMRLRKLDDPLRFHCVACDREKISRTFAVLDKDFLQLICNGCYGFMMSQQGENIE